MIIDAHRQAMAEAVVTKAAQQVPLTGSDSELKYDGSLVTHWDKAVEETVAQELKELDPATHLVGEESHGSREDRIGWILDPIDGTANFSRGLQYFGISLAYHGEGGERAGAIWDASRRKLCTPNNVLASRRSVPLSLSFCAIELDGPVNTKHGEWQHSRPCQKLSIRRESQDPLPSGSRMSLTDCLIYTRHLDPRSGTTRPERS